MSNIDQQFVEFVVKSLVSKPNAVQVERRIDEKGVLLELTVDPEDLGRVIGKRGATAQSLRTLLRALGTKNDARYNLKIVDNGEPRPHREDSRSYGNDNSSAAPAYDNSSSDNDMMASTDTPADNDMDEPSEPAEAETPAETSADPGTSEEQTEDQESDRFSKTRQELEDLDDLDV
ncbi:MAG TPA: KH domain-containing protein [Candidatus Saccharimonadales bacterium]|nr:KH domain-containing protein [Candidatus Saccharimonadales bacterium]